MSAAGPGHQLAFDLPHRPAGGREDLMVSPSNAEAVALLDGGGWPDARLALVGPPGAGKSHLAALWARERGARLVSAARLADADPVDLAARPLAVEDADRWLASGAAPEPLFHLLNACAAAATPFLLTARLMPAEWDARLPDLASRLAATTPAAIRAPDDVMLSVLLLKLFADRQLRVAPALIGWLLPRMERSHAAAAAVVDRLDRAALARGQDVTQALARDVLGPDLDTPPGGS